MNPFIPIIIIGVLLIITGILILADRLLGSTGEKILSVNNSKKFNIRGETTILDALSAQKIFVPSACGGKANCGVCKVQVNEGGGDIKPTEEPWLSEADRKNNVRLSCQIKVRGEVKVSIPESMLSAEEFTSKVSHMEDLTHDIKLTRFKLIDPPKMDFRPGQYCQIKVPGIETVRAYSIAGDAKKKDQVEFIVRYVPKGEATTFVHKAMESGDNITITGPYGDFYLRDNNKPAVFIAGGSGKAPIRSILFQLRDMGFPRKVKYFFGAKSKKDLYYTEEMRALEKEFDNFEYIPALSHPEASDNWKGKTGLITDVLDESIGDLKDHEAYLCGSPGMLDACIKVLEKHDIPDDSVFFDKFS